MKNFDMMHNYSKLVNQKFTTIRGKSRFDHYKIGDVAKVTQNGHELFDVVVKNLKVVKIKDIPLEMLRADTLCDIFSCQSHQEFIGFMNSMRKGYKPKLTSIDDEVTFFILERCYTAPCFRCSDPVVVDKVETHGRVSVLCKKCQTQIKCG